MASSPILSRSPIPSAPVHYRPTRLAFGFHLLSFLNLSHSVWLISQGVDMPGPPPDEEDVMFGGHGLFLTIWGLVLTWADFALKILFYFPSTLPNVLEQFLGILNLIALALETLITLLYWPIMLYDPSLMLPPPPIIPPPLSLDLALHLFPTIFLWIDHLFFAPPLDTTHANIILIVFTLVYTSWIELMAAYVNKNKLPYPFLTIVSRPVRYLIYAFAAILCRLVIYLATSARSSS